MKKIIALLVFVLGISFSASAQEKTTESNTQIQAKNLATKIKDYLKLDDSKANTVLDIIEHKSNMMKSEPNLIEERKVLLNNKFTKKLEGTLSTEEFNKLKANKSLFEEFLKV